MLRLALSLLGALALSACAGTAGTVDTKTLKQTAFTVYGTYTVLREAAGEYNQLGRCEIGTPPPCSRQPVVNELRRLDSIAAPKVQAMATYARQVAPEVSGFKLAIDGARLAMEQFQTYAISNGVN